MEGELFLQNIFLEEWQYCKAKNGNLCLRKPGLVCGSSLPCASAIHIQNGPALPAHTWSFTHRIFLLRYLQKPQKSEIGVDLGVVLNM